MRRSSSVSHRVRGIGKWKIAYGLDEMLKPKELQALGEKFRPHRSVAAWYLWRATDLSRSPDAASSAPTP